jgi:hypothetical protein
VDPDEVLRLLRNAIGELSALNDEDASQVVESFASLDQWLSTGGFLPSAWATRVAAPTQRSTGQFAIVVRHNDAAGDGDVIAVIGPEGTQADAETLCETYNRLFGVDAESFELNPALRPPG